MRSKKDLEQKYLVVVKKELYFYYLVKAKNKKDARKCITEKGNVRILIDICDSGEKIIEVKPYA